VETIVAEARISTNESDTSFNKFVDRNMEDISQIIDDHRRQFGYVRDYPHLHIPTFVIDTRKSRLKSLFCCVFSDRFVS